MLAAAGIRDDRPQQRLPVGERRSIVTRMRREPLGSRAFGDASPSYGKAGAGVRVSRLVRRLTPPQMVVFSFAAVILTGSALLALPISSTGERSSAIDALFTATSATCVTGLITRDTSRDWSLLGQVVILGLIQVGGLGIMSLSALVQILLNRPIGARGQDALDQALDLSMRHQLRDVLRVIGLSTLAIEGFGFIALAPLFARHGMPAGASLWHAGFHSVSAFCNAGFSVDPRNLEGYATDPWVLFCVAALIDAEAMPGEGRTRTGCVPSRARPLRASDAGH